jgi:hypothetical protein
MANFIEIGPVVLEKKSKQCKFTNRMTILTKVIREALSSLHIGEEKKSKYNLSSLL